MTTQSHTISEDIEAYAQWGKEWFKGGNNKDSQLLDKLESLMPELAAKISGNAISPNLSVKLLNQPYEPKKLHSKDSLRAGICANGGALSNTIGKSSGRSFKIHCCLD